MQFFDIVIVGAGPAGCNAARLLAHEFSVLLVDFRKFPRHKACGGILVDESLDYLSGLDLSEEILYNPKKPLFRIVDWDNELNFSTQRNFWNVGRKAFDYWLLNLIPESVQKMPLTKLIDFQEKENKIIVKLKSEEENFEVKCNYLISAEGANSIIRQKLGGNKIKFRIAMQEIIENNLEDKKSMWFIYDNEITDYYSWVIPKGNVVILGSGLDPINPNEKFELFRKKLKEKLNINGKLIRKEAAIILEPEKEEDIFLGKNNILIIGEAAGLISPSTGEGISFALRSSDCVAKAILKKENVLENYKQNINSLIEEIKGKIKKRNAIANPEIRKKAFEKLAQK